MTIPPDERLRVIEVYPSLQGESTWVGLPCVFVRLAGCNLRCTWCDSTFTFVGGEHRSIDDVLGQVASFRIPLVEVTGGEPLVHRQAIPLLQRLVDAGHTVLLETSGSRSIAAVPHPVHVILDLKPPDSGEEAANLWSNLPLLRPHHELKVVLASRRDYDWACEVLARHDLLGGPARGRPEVLFSCAFGLLAPAEVAAWIVADRLPVRFQVQAHKVIWPPEARGV